MGDLSRLGSRAFATADRCAAVGKKLLEGGPRAALAKLNERGAVTGKVRAGVTRALVGLAHGVQDGLQNLGVSSVFVDGAQNGFPDIRHSAARTRASQDPRAQEGQNV